MNQNTAVEPDFSGVVRLAPEKSVKQMLTVEWDGNQTLVKINSSSLSLIQTCPRKAFYTLHEGWKSRYGSSPLIFGSALHKGLQVFYEHPARDRTMPVNFEHHAFLMAKGYDAPEKHFMYDAIAAFVQSAKSLELLADDDPRSVFSGVWVLRNYFETYLNDQYEIHTDEHGPLVEREFSLPFYEDARLRIELFGTIDFALRNTITNEILVGDHKTTSRMDSGFMNRVKPNHQYTGYLFAGHKVLGTSSENFLVNGIEVKAKPKTARGSPPKFIRQITRRSPEDFVEFHWAVRDAVDGYLRWKERDRWPLGNADACSLWGGCQYLEVCAAPSELRQNILEAKFRRA